MGGEGGEGQEWEGGERRGKMDQLLLNIVCKQQH